MLTNEELEKIRILDTCTASGAIERLNVRLRDEGFIESAVKCQFPRFAPVLGYAATARACSSSTPVRGHCLRYCYDRIDWWEYVLSIPAPRVMVLQDVDRRPGVGAFCGEIHAHIAQAVGCTGCVTNGAVCDLEAVEKLGFQMFSRGVSVSQSYAHIVDFGKPVEIGNLKISPGDLLHGDRHGVHMIPAKIAGEIPQTAADLIAEREALIELCSAPDFSIEKLANHLLQNASHA